MPFIRVAKVEIKSGEPPVLRRARGTSLTKIDARASPRQPTARRLKALVERAGSLLDAGKPDFTAVPPDPRADPRRKVSLSAKVLPIACDDPAERIRVSHLADADE